MSKHEAMPLEGAVLEALLAPLPLEGGAGAALRYVPVYQQIQDARRHDDASLPMGDWDRPLQKADWPLVAALCQEALATQGKDLQVAAWLCEAWTRLHGLEGLAAGIRVLDGLLQRYWETAWPRMEDEDAADARCAPFIWLDTTLSLACTLHLPLLRAEDREPPEINLYDWERACNTSRAISGIETDAESEFESESAEPALSRDALMPYAALPANRAGLQSMVRFVDAAAAAWEGLERRLDERLGRDAPGLRRTPDVLARLARVAGGLLAEHSIRSGGKGETIAGDARKAPALTMPGRAHADQEAAAIHDPVDAGVVASLGPLTNRAQAYRQLSRIADYLAAIEPHSPTPYLLRKAVAWGGMSLADLMQEVAQEEGGMARYLSLLNE
ncbi:type VI secretion system protein TssA [Achromobacter sp. K91]|uniref:type VI secretion system protein TssA n=1 Tax=Achromobacter sp. K91 TaxID=2292262 RepID=UPI001F2B3833|nr:type VI secretion system protein TssA [Achromobacter sp. K91]